MPSIFESVLTRCRGEWAGDDLTAKPGQFGKIIFLNGASSSGKSTLAKALQDRLDEPFWHFSIDHLRESKVLPDRRIASGDFRWSDMRSAFFDGFHLCLPALALAGNNLIVEHIIETEEWNRRLVEILQPFDVFLIAVRCPLKELERREIERGDRRIGDAKQDFHNCHNYSQYDLEIDTTNPLNENTNLVIASWKSRLHLSAFKRMATES